MAKNNFDFLRFLFAFIVVLFHIVDLSQNADIHFLKPYFDFYLSVTGFFVISGFLVTGSYIKSQNIKQYFLKRARRLLPAYIFVILCCALFFSLAGTFSLADYFKSSMLFKYLATNLLFLNFLQPCLPGLFLNNLICTVNGALWTIKVEVCFYLILPLLIIIANRIRKKYILFISIYLLAILYQNLCVYFSGISPEHAHLFKNLKHQLPGFMTYFISGIALYYYIDIFNKKKHLWLLLALPVFVIEYYFKLEILRPVSLSVIILYVALGFKSLNNFGRYGDFSYGIYIYHFPLIQLVVSLNWFNKYNPWLVAIGIIITVLFLSILSWNFLENKFLHRKRIAN
jgi:peptidoglycan/LPS O-acetylase OafA/YrhL